MTSPSLTSERRDYFIGIVLLLIVVFLWVLSNFAAQEVFEVGYNKPFLIAWLKLGSFALYLIPIGLKKLLETRGGPHHGRQSSGYERLTDDPAPRNYATMGDPVAIPCENQPPPLTAMETLKLAFISCFLWFGYIWSIVSSLDYTSVASATIIGSTTGFFTLCIGRMFRVELLSMVKVLVVTISFSGVVLVSLSDSRRRSPRKGNPGTTGLISEVGGFALDEEYPNAPLGDSLALLSAVFFAAYTIMFKIKVGQESRIDMMLFFGLLGLCVVVFLWPVGLILHLTGAEPFELPTDGRAVLGIAINMFVTVVADFIYVIAMLKTTPLVVTVGLSLTIPVAVAGDFMLGRTVTLMSLLGAFLVLGSFIALGFENAKDREVPAEGTMSRDRSQIRQRVTSEVEDRPAA